MAGKRELSAWSSMDYQKLGKQLQKQWPTWLWMVWKKAKIVQQWGHRLFVENGRKVAHYSQKEMQYMWQWMSSRAPWNHLYEAKRRYSLERAPSIIKACASSWSHGRHVCPWKKVSVQSTHPFIPCGQWLRMSSQHLLYLLSYLGAALCIQADAVPGSYPKRASLSMWWREEIKFYTVMYWCLKHETDMSFFYRRVWDPPFSILIGRQAIGILWW